MSSADGLLADYESTWSVEYNDLKLEKVIGRGAFGEVWLATFLGADVAVKRLTAEDPDDEENAKYLRREINMLQGMRHPQILTFIGVARHEGGSYLVTEYLDGGNLREVLKSDRELPWKTRMRNIIFRDMKSKNVLLDASMRAKVCDFGFARLHEAASAATSDRRAAAMTICGTDDWMAPEVILGMDYNEFADVYSYGIVLLEIITREKVSVALQRSPMDAFDLDEERTRSLLPADCPTEFSDLAFACASYESSKRPSFREVAASLRSMWASCEDAPSGRDLRSSAPGAMQSTGRGQRARGGRGRGRARGGFRGAPQRGLPRGRRPAGAPLRSRGTRGRGAERALNQTA